MRKHSNIARLKRLESDMVQAEELEIQEAITRRSITQVSLVWLRTIF